MLNRGQAGIVRGRQLFTGPAVLTPPPEVIAQHESSGTLCCKDKKLTKCTTGRPKGRVLANQMWITALASCVHCPSFDVCVLQQGNDWDPVLLVAVNTLLGRYSRHPHGMKASCTSDRGSGAEIKNSCRKGLANDQSFACPKSVYCLRFTNADCQSGTRGMMERPSVIARFYFCSLSQSSRQICTKKTACDEAQLQHQFGNRTVSMFLS